MMTISLSSRVADHAADEIRQYIADTNRVDRMAPFDGQDELVRATYLQERPDGIVSDFISWCSKMAADANALATIRKGRESQG